MNQSPGSQVTFRIEGEEAVRNVTEMCRQVTVVEPTDDASPGMPVEKQAPMDALVEGPNEIKEPEMAATLIERNRIEVKLVDYKGKSNALAISVRVRGYECRGVLPREVCVVGLADTGASVSLMRDTTYLETGGKLENLRPYRGKITTAADQNLQALGEVELKMEIEGQDYSQRIVVVKGLTSSLIIGLDFLRKNGAEINVNHRIMSIYIPLDTVMANVSVHDEMQNQPVTPTLKTSDTTQAPVLEAEKIVEERKEPDGCRSLKIRWQGMGARLDEWRREEMITDWRIVEQFDNDRQKKALQREQEQDQAQTITTSSNTVHKRLGKLTRISLWSTLTVGIIVFILLLPSAKDDNIKGDALTEQGLAEILKGFFGSVAPMMNSVGILALASYLAYQRFARRPPTYLRKTRHAKDCAEPGSPSGSQQEDL